MTDVTVHTLRLRIGRGGAPPGLAAQVEDALRISSKPAALTHRTVWVKRLRLAAKAGPLSAQSLALLLEQEWAQWAGRAQPIAQAGPDAEAVWAASEAEARLALLARWLEAAREGREVAAEPWFWQRVAPLATARSALISRIASLLFDEPGADRSMARPATARVAGACHGRRWRRKALQRQSGPFAATRSDASSRRRNGRRCRRCVRQPQTVPGRRSSPCRLRPAGMGRALAHRGRGAGA